MGRNSRIVYWLRGSDRVHVGLPLAVIWRPVEDLTINLSYVTLTIVNARATYGVADKLSIFGGF